MRLFVAAWPPAEVLDAVRTVHRPTADGLRWVEVEALHVTVRFLGSVEEDLVPRLADALIAAGRAVPPPEAVLAPATARLGRTVLVVPVAGLDGVAAAVERAVVAAGLPPETRPFTGHLTLARARGRRGAVPRAAAGVPVPAASWRVGELTLVRSHLGGRHGSRYEVVAQVPLTGEGA